MERNQKQFKTMSKSSYICRSCGRSIPQQRIDALTLNGRFELPKKLSCVECTTVNRVAGYMPSESKMLGQIIIADQETVANLHKDAWRAGTGVSRGMKN